MFTICWTASSWPTTRLSRVFSRHSASWPVLVGSRTFRKRLISARPSFLFFRQIPVTPQQCEIDALNLSELHIQLKQFVCQSPTTARASTCSLGSVCFDCFREKQL